MAAIPKDGLPYDPQCHEKSDKWLLADDTVIGTPAARSCDGLDYIPIRLGRLDRFVDICD